MQSNNGAVATSTDSREAAEPAAAATVTSIRSATPERASTSTSSYEPWLLQMMMAELTERELGLGFIYSVLDYVAERHALTDVVVVLNHDTFGVQMFRLGARVIGPDIVARVGTDPGVYCEPDLVPEVECDAVRTAATLSFALHVARFSAAHDPLTNIANRRNFDESLEVAAARSARYGWAFTVLLLDLNNFKMVNDNSGHQYGDVILRQFGFALRQTVRQGDTAARIGGDEFAVILSNAEGHESAGFTERLRGHLASAGNSVEFAVGAASSPRDSTDPAELLRIADSRLYEKKGGRPA